MTTSLMALEIDELPAVARRLLTEGAPVLRDAAEALRRADPQVVVTVARGSSDHAATFLKYATELMAGIPVASVGPSLASIYHRTLRLGQGACIGISQSGQSPDIVAMLRTAREGGALTLALTNHPGSPMAAGADFPLPLMAGPERSVAATKTFVASLIAGLALIADWQDDAGLRAALKTLPDALQAAAALDWSALDGPLTGAASLFTLGRGPALAIAAEAALKGKETCGLHAEAFSTAEVLHGPGAIVGAGFPVLVFAVDDAALPQTRATVERLVGQGAKVFVTGLAVPGATTLPVVAGLHPLIAPVTLIAAFYRVAERVSRRRGFSPDAPPHLRKVTETL